MAGAVAVCQPSGGGVESGRGIVPSSFSKRVRGCQSRAVT